MKRSVALLVAALLALVAPEVRASDHLDGPATSKDRVTDLSDLYAFPTPQAPGFLAIVLEGETGGEAALNLGVAMRIRKRRGRR